MKPTTPRSLLYYICLCDLFSFAFIFRSIKPKIQKYLTAIYSYFILFGVRSINLLQFIHVCLPISRRRYPKGIDNPFYTPGCKYLLFVCRCCLRGVRRFSYWFDNLGLITKGNTYRHYTASSPSSLGKYRRSSSRHHVSP